MRMYSTQYTRAHTRMCLYLEPVEKKVQTCDTDPLYQGTLNLLTLNNRIE